MTAAADPRPDGLPATDLDAPALDVVIPVHNEEMALAGSVGGPGLSAGGSTASQISTWVEKTFTARTVDGVTLYDLTSG